MLIHFTKMQGLGNDFVVIDAIRQSIDLSTPQIRQLCDRRFGVGCDQLLLVEKADRPLVDFRYRIFNADGSEVEQCGNGARCFARFVHDEGLTDKKDIPVSTRGGNILLHIQADGQVRVNMGEPKWQPADIPFISEQQQTVYTIDTDMGSYPLSVVSMGNPHAVLIVDDSQEAPVETLGVALENHPRFPERVNVGFMQIIDQKTINLRVFERGVGETLACGTGACAAVVAGRLRNKLSENVIVHLPGGNLEVTWQGAGKPVYMTGPAETVFKGSLLL